MSYDLDNVLSRVSTGDALLIDVRENEEWNIDRLIHAKLLPLSQIQNELITDDYSKDQEMYLHCVAGIRSAMATDIMKSHGFSNVTSLNESYDELKAKGL